MFSNDILNDRIVTNKSCYRKNGYKFEFEFQIFVQREVQVMGFQELCLLCYETHWLRHSQVVRVAQSLLAMAASHRLKCSCTRFSETSLTATTYGPLV